MATLREVKKRIRSVISTKRITKAMEMVSAAKLRRAQQKVEQSRPYGKMMEEEKQRIFSNIAVAAELSQAATADFLIEAVSEDLELK